MAPQGAPGPQDAPAPQASTGENQMTLISPTGTDDGNETDWAVVLGVALIAEVALLWAAACLGLWRHRRNRHRGNGHRQTATAPSPR